MGLNLVVLGPPGAGKGTQSKKISVMFSVPQISTGDMLRDAVKNCTTLGLKAKGFMDSGGLVPDEVVIGIVEERLKKADCKDGFILDGFPRTIAQAESLNASLQNDVRNIDHVINVHVPMDYLIKRLSGRRTCQSCTSGYHIDYSPPVKSGVCDSCGSQLIQRDDDKEEVVLKRLETYEKMTAPLISYYEGMDLLRTVSGVGSIDDIFAQISKIIR